MPRSAIAISLPPAEFNAVRDQLAEAGYEAIRVESADELEQLLTDRADVHCAILDGETDFDRTLEMYSVLRDGDRNIPALMLMPPRALGRMGLGGRADARDEYFTRPYSAESLRWRVEAMLIRVENVPKPPLTALCCRAVPPRRRPRRPKPNLTIRQRSRSRARRDRR